MKEFIEFIIKYLVDDPESVVVSEITGEKITICKVRVGEGDLGKVIGKHGNTANSIRTILSAASAKQGRRAVLELLE